MLALSLKALSHRNRLAIVNLLLQEGRLAFTQIRERLGLAPQSLKNHLTMLTEGNLIERRLKAAKATEYRSYYQISQYGRRLVFGILDSFHEMKYEENEEAYRPVTAANATDWGIVSDDQPSTAARRAAFERLLNSPGGEWWPSRLTLLEYVSLVAEAMVPTPTMDPRAVACEAAMTLFERAPQIPADRLTHSIHAIMKEEIDGHTHRLESLDEVDSESLVSFVRQHSTLDGVKVRHVSGARARRNAKLRLTLLRQLRKVARSGRTEGDSSAIPTPESEAKPPRRTT